jgi:hypothetical protein
VLPMPRLFSAQTTRDAGGAVTIRSARSSDAPALHVLAALDSARPLRGEAIVAEIDGRVVAAVQREDGRAIADPFVPSAGAVELLRARTMLPARKRRRPSFGGFGALRPRLA